MFGRHPILPIDLILNRTPKPVAHKNYVDKWKNTMQEAYKIVMENIQKQHDYDDKRKSLKRNLGPLLPKDRVLIRNLREKGGPGKLRSHWESDLYEVLQRIGGENGVVYQVRKLGQPDSEIRTIHRNMLLVCNEFPIGEGEDIKDNLRQESETPIQTKQHRQGQRHSVWDKPSAEEEEEDNVSEELTPNQYLTLQKILETNRTACKKPYKTNKKHIP